MSDYLNFLIVYLYAAVVGGLAGFCLCLELIEWGQRPPHPAIIVREMMEEPREEELSIWWCWRCELPQGGAKSENGLCLKCSFNDQQEQRVSA